MAVSINVTGMKEVANTLQNIKKETTKDVFWELFRFCNDTVVPNVKRYASQGAIAEETEPFPLGATIPISGYMANSTGIISGGGAYGKRSIIIFNSARYAKFQEFGWLMTKEQSQILAIQRRKRGIEMIPPTNLGYPHWVQHPFMRPGIYSLTNEMLKTVENAVNKKMG